LKRGRGKGGNIAFNTPFFAFAFTGYIEWLWLAGPVGFPFFCIRVMKKESKITKARLG